MGPCKLTITNTAIIVSQNNGDELATWVFNCIRQFNAVDCYFSFTSGRRGPFGVGEYCFELPQKKVAEIQKKISDCTGAVFSQNRNYNNSTLSVSTNISNPSKPNAPVTDDNSRSRSESETAPSSLVSSNLYPLTTPSKSTSYQNTGIRRAIAPPLPSKDPIKPSVILQDDLPNAKYVNAMKKNIPKPLPRTMKPSIKKNGLADNAKPLVCLGGDNSTVASSLPHTNKSVTLPAYSQRSQAVTTSEATINPVGAQSDLNKDPVDYGDMVCSPHGPGAHHQPFSPPPRPINSGYSDVDYDVIRRNREMGKFSDPDGAYSDTKNKKGMETYDVPPSLPAAEDTYDVPRSAGRKFEAIPDVYEDDTKHSSPNDLYSVPTSNQRVSPEVYDVLPSRGKTVLQAYSASSRQDQIYDNPKSSNVTNDDDLYDTPRFSQPVAGGHETYDVVPSQRAHSTSPQQQKAIMRKTSPGYENIGPHGEVLGEIVADQLRQELLNSLNGGSNRQFLPRSLKSVNSNFSRSCEFLNGVIKEPSKRFSTSSTYKRVIMPDQDSLQRGVLPTPSRHSHNFRRRLSGSLGDIPAAETNDDDGTYVVLNKTEKPIRKPPLPAPKSATVAAACSTDRMEDNGESNDMYIVMNRSPSHSTSSSSGTNIETLPKGYIRMNTVKEALVQKSYSSTEIVVRKQKSPINNEGRRNSDLVWPGNSGWGSWNSPDDQVSRNSSDTSEVFSPPPIANEHPIVVSKSAIRPRKSVLLKGVSPQPVPGHEKRMGKSVIRYYFYNVNHL